MVIFISALWSIVILMAVMMMKQSNKAALISLMNAHNVSVVTMRNAHITAIEDLHKVLLAQSAFIQKLQADKEDTKQKIDELVLLLPEALHSHHENLIMEEMPDGDSKSAAVVMFRQLEEARKIVAKHVEPNSPLGMALKEILK